MPVNTRDILSVMALTGLLTGVLLAQAPAVSAARPATAATRPATPAATPAMTITATSANVTGAGEKVEFFINRWSSDADRDKLSAAWNTKPAPPAAAGARAGAAEGAAAGRGGAGRGAA